jgi:hypothetical protein
MKRPEAPSEDSLPTLDPKIDFDGPTEITTIPDLEVSDEPLVLPTEVQDLAQENLSPVEAEVPPSPPAALPLSEAASRRSLAEIWPEPPRKRQLPTRLRIALAGVALVLVAIIAFGSPGTKLQTQAPTALNDEMVVSADDLKNRREVRAEDFRPRGAAQLVVAQAPAAGPVPAAPQRTEETLAERRARRQSDPEDVLSLKTRRGTAKAPATDAPWYDGPIYVTAGSAAGAGNAPGPSGRSAVPAESGVPGVLAAAGTSVPAVLTSPIELRGDSATVIARADGQPGVLRGARFIGTASAGAGRMTIHFRAVVLADGRQAHADGEAQDEDGSFGLRVEGETSVPSDGHGSVLGDVAQETATDVLSSTIGIGVAGQAVDRYISGSRARRTNSSARPVSLPAGTKLQVFLHEAVELGR